MYGYEVTSLAFLQDNRYAMCAFGNCAVRRFRLDTGLAETRVGGNHLHRYDKVLSILPPIVDEKTAGRALMLSDWGGILHPRSAISGGIMTDQPSITFKSDKGAVGVVTCAALSASGEFAVSGHKDSMVRLWDVKTGKQIHAWKGHSMPVTSVAFSPNGRRILSGSEDRTLMCWEVGQEKDIGAWSGHSGAITCIAFSPDGRRAVSGSTDKTVRVWGLPK